MSIFNFSEEQSLGEVRSVETSRITVRVTDGKAFTESTSWKISSYSICRR